MISLQCSNGSSNGVGGTELEHLRHPADVGKCRPVFLLFSNFKKPGQ